MDPKRPPGMLFAPAAAGAEHVVRAPAQRSLPSLPGLNEHLVEPETSRNEIVRGRRVVAQPALEPHGDKHCELDFVVRAHVRPEYVSSTDLLTRLSHESDFATDTCVRRAGLDLSTGQRWLEELAFEVVHTQTLRDMTERAEDLTGRGVRRVFGIFVKDGSVREWSPDARAFRKLNPESAIEDVCLSHPIPVKALLSAAEADNAVARALLAKGNPVLAEAEAKAKAAGEADGFTAGKKEGRAEGKAEAILAVFAARGAPISDQARARILSCTDSAALDAWLLKAVRAGSADEMLAGLDAFPMLFDVP